MGYHCTIKICLFWGGGRLKHIQVCQGLPRSNAWDLKICSTTLCVLFLEIPFTGWWCVRSRGIAECMDMFWWKMTFETVYVIQALTIPGTIRSVLFPNTCNCNCYMIIASVIPVNCYTIAIAALVIPVNHCTSKSPAVDPQVVSLFQYRCLSEAILQALREVESVTPNRFRANRLGELIQLVKWWPQPIDKKDMYIHIIYIWWFNMTYLDISWHFLTFNPGYQLGVTIHFLSGMPATASPSSGSSPLPLDGRSNCAVMRITN
jgi:hypothetical protein